MLRRIVFIQKITPTPRTRSHLPGTILLLVAALGILTGIGCRTKPFASYPVGIYGVGSDDLAAVREAGFNLVAGPAEKHYLDAAHRLGLGVMASPGTSAGDGFDAAKARAAVSQFDSHPGLWAWYLIDEPDLNRVAPDQVRNANRFLKNLPARKPTTLVIYQGYTARDYANIADVTMIDRYPVPWLPLANVAQHVRMTRLALGPDKPLISILQAFDWTAYPEQLPGETNLRPPTHTELRCMAYSSLAQGANGLFFFAFDSGTWKLRDHPAVWTGVQQVVAEVHRRLPLFEAEHLWYPFHTQYGDRSIRFNEALDASISVSMLRVHKGNTTLPAGDYVLAVNTTPLRHNFSFRLAHLTMGAVAVHEENRLVPILQSWVSDDFDPYAVHVYGPLSKSYTFPATTSGNR